MSSPSPYNDTQPVLDEHASNTPPEPNNRQPDPATHTSSGPGFFKEHYERAKRSFDIHPLHKGKLNLLLDRGLEGYHAQMIALGSAIGTGLFLASGEALAIAGPIPLLAAFSFVGLTFCFTMLALGEMATCLPLPGGFFMHCTMFTDEAWGGAMGWNYVFQWLVTLPLELVASSITLQYWKTPLPPGLHSLFVSVFIISLILINVFGVKGYGAIEVGLSLMKIIAIIGFIIFSVLRDAGFLSHGQAIGVQYWFHPGAAHNSMWGFLSVLITAAFAYSGSEVVGLTAAEQKDPTREMPRAVRKVFWRIGLFYILSIFFIGLLVPYDDPMLLTNAGSFNAAASPFVIAVKNASVNVLPSILNVVILLTVLSVANSSVYGSSRVLVAMADAGLAPMAFRYIDTKGRPLRCLYLSLLFAGLAYFVELKQQTVIFTWLLSLCGLSVIISWSSICWTHIRFRRAMRYHGRKLSTLTYQSPAGLIGSRIGLVLNLFIILAQFLTAILPIGHEKMSHGQKAQYFFQNFMAFPLVVILFVAFKFFKTARTEGVFESDTWKVRLNRPRIVRGPRTVLVTLRPPPTTFVERAVQTDSPDMVATTPDDSGVVVTTIQTGIRPSNTKYVDWSEAFSQEDYLREMIEYPEEFPEVQKLWWCWAPLRPCIQFFCFPWDPETRNEQRDRDENARQDRERAREQGRARAQVEAENERLAMEAERDMAREQEGTGGELESTEETGTSMVIMSPTIHDSPSAMRN